MNSTLTSIWPPNARTEIGDRGHRQHFRDEGSI